MCVLVLVTVHQTEAQTADNVKALMMKLFTTDGYNKKVRPVANQNEPILVYCDFVLSSIIDFNEQEESLKVSGYLVLQWKDEFLTWDPDDYGGLDRLILPQDDIWRPDASLRNPFKTFTGLGSTFLNVKVDNQGNVIWMPFQVLESTCDVNITYFPFDVQECPIKIIAWSYSKEEVEINEGNNGIYLDEFEENALWNLIGTSAEEVNTEEAAVIFKIKMKRKPTYYVINIIMPVTLLSFLNVITFALPVTSGERASYAITVFLSMAVFLTIVSAELPKNSNVVSLMAVYLLTMSCLSTAIVTISLLELRLLTRHLDNRPVTRFYKRIYNVCKRLQCKGEKIGKKGKVGANSVPSLTEKSNNIADDGSDDVNWKNVTSSLDYMFFWIFLISSAHRTGTQIQRRYFRHVVRLQLDALSEKKYHFISLKGI
ncbi:neuronal acetylcholine receptor subunit beta-3-like isoform X2 [Mya arenaria]|nr:neuronal acetylcholine receptor subunit beta-3-like isoform X2 [Mya arenaria]